MALHFARRPAEPASRLPPGAPPALPAAATGGVSQHSPCQTILQFLPRTRRTASNAPAANAHSLELCLKGGAPGLMIDADLLVSNIAAWSRSLAQLLSRVGYDCEAECADRAWRNRHLADVFRGRRELGDVLDEYLRSLPLAGGCRDEVFAASLAQWRAGQAQLCLLPGMRKTLRRLSAAGAEIVIVADAALSGQELASQFSQAGLDDVALSVISSVDLDCLLPESEFYASAISLMKLDAGEVLAVLENQATGEAAIQAGPLAACDGGKLRCAPAWHAARLEELLPIIEAADLLAKAG